MQTGKHGRNLGGSTLITLLSCPFAGGGQGGGGVPADRGAEEDGVHAGRRQGGAGARAAGAGGRKDQDRRCCSTSGQ
jgi:hypothetical protein